MKIAVYGASGYQGKLVLTELARRNIETVLAGRNPARLEETASAAGLLDAERRVADTSDQEALVRAFRGCDGVINCAGPFTSSGEAVVRAAIAAGCHYVDTSASSSTSRRSSTPSPRRPRTLGPPSYPPPTTAASRWTSWPTSWPTTSARSKRSPPPT